MAEQKEQVHGTREQALKRRQLQRKKALRRRRRILIASIAAIVIAAVLIIVLLVRGLVGKKVEETALTLNEDGSVTFEEVMEFDSDTYSKAEMKKFVKNMVDSYDGAGEVTLNSVSADKSKAYVSVTYDSMSTYAEFTGYPAYAGTIADAKEDGYTFDLTFEEVADGHIGDIVTASDAVSDENRNVIILQENVVVNVPGKIAYITTNGISVRDGDTVEIVPVNGNADAAVSAYIIY